MTLDQLRDAYFNLDPNDAKGLIKLKRAAARLTAPKGKEPKVSTDPDAQLSDEDTDENGNKKPKRRKGKKPEAAAKRAVEYAKSGDLRNIEGLSSYRFDDALMERAAALKRDNESVGHALLRLSKEDATSQAIAQAGEAARVVEQAMPMDQRVALLGESMGNPAPAEKSDKPAIGSVEHIERVLDDLAKATAQPGESFAASYSRMLTDNQDAIELYNLYVERRG